MKHQSIRRIIQANKINFRGFFCKNVKGIKVSDCRTKANKFILKREKGGKGGVEKLAN